LPAKVKVAASDQPVRLAVAKALLFGYNCPLASGKDSRASFQTRPRAVFCRPEVLQFKQTRLTPPAGRQNFSSLSERKPCAKVGFLVC
ncbi:MAG: hypothetical protein ONB51_04850, partial [candidate division KSB1 bacterium]|nr:hypothetical protein [candidate division KSB1 bacterium]